MRNVILYMTTTADGFIAGPSNELDWMHGTSDQELNEDIVALLQGSDAGFLGYPVAQGMIPYWEGVAADTSASAATRDLAAAVNGLHRIIISSRPVDLPWANSELVVARDDDNLVAAVTEIKQQAGHDIGLAGGVRTAQRFARLGLIDEYVLQVHPIAIGVGQPLFTQKSELQLTNAKTYESGVIRLRYQPCRHPSAGT
jgi:dihydrofolate reductase